MATQSHKLHKEVLQYSYNGKAVRFRMIEDEVYIPVTDLRRFFNIKYTEHPAYQLCPSASRIVFYRNGDTLQSIVAHDIPFLCKCGKRRELTKDESDKFEWIRSIRNHIKDQAANKALEDAGASIRVFTSQFGSIRVTIDDQNNPHFCLSDVCAALELTAKGVKQRLEDEVISNYPISDALGRQQLALFVSEDGLYDVILDSRKPEAKKFRKWVTSEVLPSIRRTGGYVVATDNDDPEVVMARGLLAAKEALERAEQRALAAEGNYAIAKPKAEYYDAVIAARELYTTLQLAGELGMCYRTLRSRLFKLGICTTLTGKLILQPDYESWGEMEEITGKKNISALKWNKEGREKVFALIAPGLPT